MADLNIIRGDDYRVVISLTSDGDPMDLTDYTARAQIRVSTALSANLIAEFAATIDDPPTDGTITLELTHTDTASIASGVWDLEIEDGDGWITTVVSGSVTATPDVTREIV
jgi:hypothetical protein